MYKYKNVGEHIKGWIIFFKVIISLLYGVVGALIGCYIDAATNGSGAAIGMAIVFFLIGLTVAYFCGMLLYAYGELVSHTIQLDEKMGTLLNFTLGTGTDFNENE